MKNLNMKQQEAVSSLYGPLRIIAGAGSGKTSVLIYKIIHLLKNNVAPHKICVITFTNKATREIMERLEQLQDQYDVQKIWVSTYHSLCARILRYEIETLNLGYKSTFNIIDTNEQLALIGRFYKEIFHDNSKRTISVIKNKISNWKNHLCDPEEIISSTFDHENKYARIYQKYQNQLNDDKVLDYDDLICFTYKLFSTNKDQLEKWQNCFDFLLVDEFQDTNDLQYEIIKLLVKRHQNITVVGDPDQNIYSWRGANPRLLINFDHFFKSTKTIFLNQNYRSNQGILNLANDFIKNNHVNDAIKKQLFTEKREEYLPQLTSFDNYEEEIAYILMKMQHLIMLGKYTYSDFYILYRSTYLSREIENQLEQANINYKTIGSFRFFERAEVKDVISILKTIVCKDNVSLLRSIKLFPAIGDKKINELVKLKNKLQKPIFDLLQDNLDMLSISTASKVSKYFTIINHFTNYKNIKSIYEMTIELLDAFYYLDKWKKDQDKLENVKELLAYIKKYEAKNSDISKAELLRRFVENINLNSTQNDDENVKAVTLMTIHAAKGLENKVVFVVSLCNNILPSYQSLRNNNLDEERRILYVAITRAKEKLFLSYNEGYSNIYKYLTKSQFLNQINEKLWNHVDCATIHVKPKLKNNFVFNKPNKSNKPKKQAPYNVNEKINHPIFGPGKVIQIEDNYNVEVKFDDDEYGQRLVNASILEKI